jgi:hypothetical protein
MSMQHILTPAATVRACYETLNWAPELKGMNPLKRNAIILLAPRAAGGEVEALLNLSRIRDGIIPDNRYHEMLRRMGAFIVPLRVVK